MPPCPVLGWGLQGTAQGLSVAGSTAPAALPWQQEAVAPRQGGGWQGELHTPGHVWGSRRKYT